MVAALVYHYEPDAGGGTALTDVCINDGDFARRRRRDGSFDVRLTAARRREAGIGPSLLLLYLIQMMAYEDWNVGGGLTGLPTLVGNPSVAFEGIVRGRRHRLRDLGRPEEDGRREAPDWIRDFGRSREGRAYRPWVDRFLAGGLAALVRRTTRASAGGACVALRTKLGVLELRARQDPASSEAASARALRAFVDRLSREIGRVPDDDPGAAAHQRSRARGLIALARRRRRRPPMRATTSPTRSRALAVPQPRSPAGGGARRARPAPRSRAGIDFGRVVADEDQGTLASLGPPPAEGGAARPLANPELFGAPAAAAVTARGGRANLPDVRGVHGRGPARSRSGATTPARVSIGRGGHFITNPESLSPALRPLDRDVGVSLLARHGRARRADRDRPVPDRRVRRRQRPPRARRPGRRRDAHGRRRSGARSRRASQYRIYETSASLRDKQRAAARRRRRSSAEGDARRPAETLKRDFPDGVRGFVVTNEVPDAFGVHKVVLTADGRRAAALVVPRVESRRARCRRRRALAADRRGGRGRPPDVRPARERRRLLPGRASPGRAVMEALSAALPPEKRDALLDLALWFEEAYVPAAAVPELAAHLAAGAAQYATALAAEDSGVVAIRERPRRPLHPRARRRRSRPGSSSPSTTATPPGAWSTAPGAASFRFASTATSRTSSRGPTIPTPLPGTQDMTADVNFTDLARAGRSAGLEVLHFGPERDLVGDELPGAPRRGRRRRIARGVPGKPRVQGAGARDARERRLHRPAAVAAAAVVAGAGRPGGTAREIAAIQAALAAAADVSARR